jgi:hypothetical protein
MSRISVVLVFGTTLLGSAALAKDATENTKGMSDPRAAWDTASSAQRLSLAEEHAKTIAEVAVIVNEAVADAQHDAAAHKNADNDARLACVRNKLASLTALQKASSMATQRLQASMGNAPDTARSEFVRISMAANEALDIGVETDVCSERKAVPQDADTKAGSKD